MLHGAVTAIYEEIRALYDKLAMKTYHRTTAYLKTSSEGTCSHKVYLHMDDKYIGINRGLRILTEIVGKWVTAKESYKTVQFAYTILKWCARQTPFIIAVKLKRSFSSICRSLFNIVSFIKL